MAAAQFDTEPVGRFTAAQEPRLQLRAGLGEILPSIVERDLFMQRLVQLIAQVAEQPLVALYTRGANGGDLIVRASTLPEPGTAPARMPVASLGGGVAELAVSPDHAALVIPIEEGGAVLGAVLLFSTGGRFGDRERDLLAELVGEIGVAIEIAEQHHAIKQSSVLDLSTGAYAGWFLSQRLEEEIARAQRSGRSVTVVLATILDFPEVQGAHPFERVDALLRDLADELAGATRLFDVVARRGPGEFAILLPDSDIEGAGTVIDRLRARVARVNQRFGRETGGALPAVPIRVVTGLASYPIDGDRVATLLLAAEHRLNEDELVQRRLSGLQ